MRHFSGFSTGLQFLPSPAAGVRGTPPRTTDKMLRPGTFALTLLLAMLTALGPLSMDMYLPSLPDIARVLARADRACAADGFGLPDRVCRRPGGLRSVVGSSWPPACPACSTRALPREHARLRRIAVGRSFDWGAVPPGRRRVGLDRAVARHRARSLFRRAGGARAVADGVDRGVCPDRGADDRRRVSVRVRLACEFHLHGRCGNHHRFRGGAAIAGDACAGVPANLFRCGR